MIYVCQIITFFVYCASRHHSVVEHREILEKLKYHFDRSSPMTDFSKCYRAQLLCEEFILNEFIPVKDIQNTQCIVCTYIYSIWCTIL